MGVIVAETVFGQSHVSQDYLDEPQKDQSIIGLEHLREDMATLNKDTD